MDEAARDGQHLLLAAGKKAAAVGDALLEAGKVPEDLGHPRPGLLARAAGAEHGQTQIIAHREIGQHAALLGDPCDAAPDDLVRIEPRQVRVAETDAAACGAGDAHDR
jgi:hypothetical protein